MSKKRVYEFARELNIESKDVLKKAKELGIQFKSHMSSMEDDEMIKVRQAFQNKSEMKAEKKNISKDNRSKANRPKEEHNQKNKMSKGNKKANKKSTKQPHDNRSKQKQESAKSKKENQHPKRTTNEQERQELKKDRQKQNQSKKQSRQFRGINGGPAGNRRKNKRNKNQGRPAPATPRKDKPLPTSVEYTEGMNIAELSKKIHREPAELVKKLFLSGVMATQNDSLSKDAIELLLLDYGIEPIEKVEVDVTDFDTYFDQEVDEDKLVSRPATVTIMGHVDHGKTTLLDTLRESSVAEGEAGGITQHIGAYQLNVHGETITFLDTPGHAAFTTMRARGADVTDIVIIVVAADDGVMPQTVEAINHAKAANVPIIVAVNKIDKPAANPDRVKQELMEYNLVPEEWGGDTIFVEISAKFNQNIEELLEMIILVAEVSELKADPSRLALGTVLEARLDKAKGPIATVLVQQGTLHQGDPIVVGTAFGRVRTMTDDKGRRIKDAGPSTPVEITGLSETPQAGDRFVVFEDERTARQIGEARATQEIESMRKNTNKVTLENLFESLEEGELKEVNVIIKADVQGSTEALASSLQKIDVEGVKVNIVHTGVGAINESDVTLASASNGIIIGFNVRPTTIAKDAAEQEQVEIRTYRVIYDAIDQIESAMKGMLDPEYEEKVIGTLTVRETYKVSKLGTIAGCYVNDGVIRRNSSVRLIRNGIVIYEGELGSLKRFENDASEVSNGYECGLTIEGYNDIKVDDQIEAYEMVEIVRQ
ncbi:translation initiation factor IF-2 [Allofustis seminis]|uniref:translation initiation factor IF-2 n=1 Tax=Allofustis seminis TaxID=166939 RepID=UPI00037F5EB1|nr:translation initiation factor IF-2 [Allofustis seminis]